MFSIRTLAQVKSVCLLASVNFIRKAEQSSRFWRILRPCDCESFLGASSLEYIFGGSVPRERRCISRIARMGRLDCSCCPTTHGAVDQSIGGRRSPFVEKTSSEFPGKCVSPNVVASGDTTQGNSSAKRTVTCSKTKSATTTAVRSTRLSHRFAFLWCRCHFAPRTKPPTHILRIKDLSIARQLSRW